MYPLVATPWTKQPFYMLSKFLGMIMVLWIWAMPSVLINFEKKVSKTFQRKQSNGRVRFETMSRAFRWVEAIRWIVEAPMVWLFLQPRNNIHQESCAQRIILPVDSGIHARFCLHPNVSIALGVNFNRLDQRNMY